MEQENPRLKMATITRVKSLFQCTPNTHTSHFMYMLIWAVQLQNGLKN